MMDETNTLRYNAFISYRHLPLDKAVATRLQTLLEAYRPPKDVECHNTNRISRIFRDECELYTSRDLGSDIRKALEQSHYFVLICSRETAKSKWCMEELRYFKQLHDGRNDHILTVLVDGEPGDVLPEELTYEQKTVVQPDESIATYRVELEPLCTDVRGETVKQSMKRLKTEFLRVAAPIMGCGYDDLYQRHHRRQRKRIAAILCSSSAVTLAVLLVILGFAYRTYLSEQSYKSTLAESYAKRGGEQAAAGNAQEAMMYYTKALELTPEDAKSAAAGAVLLLQSGGWPYFDHQQSGEILCGIPVEKTAEGLLIWARNSTGTRLLSDTMDDDFNSHYCVNDENGKILQILDDGMGVFQSASMDGSCWVFKSGKRLTLYDPDTGSSVEITVPDELSPGCDPQDILLDVASPVAMSAGEDRAVVAYGGYVRLYSLEGGGASEIIRADMADAFPEVSARNGLMCVSRLWVSSKGDLAAVSSGSSVALYRTKDLSLLSVFLQYHTPLTDVSISADSSRIALSYGNTFGDDLQTPGGYFSVYTNDGNPLYSKRFDPREPISGVAFDPVSASRLISWGAGTVRFWEIDTGVEFCMPLAVLSVMDAAFTDEGLCVVETEDHRLRYYQMLDPVFCVEQLDGDFPPVETTQTVSHAAQQVPIVEAVQGENGLPLEKVDLMGYSPLAIWPMGDQTVVYANDNHLLLFNHEQQQPRQVIALQTPGTLSSVSIDNTGNYLAVTLRVIESTADQVSYETHGVLELWDIRTGLHIMDFGNGAHDIDRATFDKDGSLVYECDGTIFRRQVLTTVPDEQTVQFLAALSCFDLDGNQNVIRKDPRSVQPGIGNWTQYLVKEAVQKEKLPAGSVVSDAGEETLETVMDALLTAHQKTSSEERAAALETVLTRLERNQLPYTPQSLSSFFSNYIVTMGRTKDDGLLRRGVLTFIDLMEDLDLSHVNGPVLYVELLMDALQQSTSFDAEVAQALENNAVLSPENLAYDEALSLHLYEGSSAICLMYAGLLRGMGVEAFEPIHAYLEKYPGEELLMHGSQTLEALCSGDVERAKDRMNAHIHTLLAMGADDFTISYFLKQELICCNVVLMRGGITSQMMNDFVDGVDADIGLLVTRLSPKGQDMGLRMGDVVLRVNGSRIFSDYQMFQFITEGVEEIMEWTVLREGDIVTINGKSLSSQEIGGKFVVQMRE